MFTRIVTFIFSIYFLFAATFLNEDKFRFIFINHSNRPVTYELGSATNGQFKNVNGRVNPGETVRSKIFDPRQTLEQGSVPVITIVDAPIPRFRFWSGRNPAGEPRADQYIDLNAEEGYAVTKKTSELSEATGNGFRVTVDGGGENNPNTEQIHIQVYNS